jgi:hypothetical protein
MIASPRRVGPVSAPGQKRRFDRLPMTSGLTPVTRHPQRRSACFKRAKNEATAALFNDSSARTRISGGTVKLIVRIPYRGDTSASAAVKVNKGFKLPVAV